MATYTPTPLPKITKSQHEILYLLFKFRFLNTHQIQKFLHLKKPQYAQELLKDLKDKGYIKTNYNPKSYIENTQPAVYFLGSKARKVLKENKNCTEQALNKIYKEQKQKDPFINHCMRIADVYFFFAENIKPDETLSFFTESELSKYGYFPDESPSAYIAVKNKEKTKRYFLEIFRETATSGNIRFRFREYVAYADSGLWEEHAQGQKFPSLFFILPTENKKKHVAHYAKAKFTDAYEQQFPFYITSLNKVLFGKDKNIWEKVVV